MNLHFLKITVLTKPCMQVLTCFSGVALLLCRTVLSFLWCYFCCCLRWFCHSAVRAPGLAAVGLDSMLPSSPLCLEDHFLSARLLAMDCWELCLNFVELMCYFQWRDEQGLVHHRWNMLRWCRLKFEQIIGLSPWTGREASTVYPYPAAKPRGII